MRTNILVLSAVLSIPLASGAAQRRSGGNPGGGEAPPARPATVGQLEDLNPARMLVDKRKKISLADSQVNQLKALDRKIADRNKPLLAQYDSVRREMHFPNSGPAGGEMASKMGSGSKRSGGATSASGGPAFPAGGGSTESPEAVALLRSQMQALGAISQQFKARHDTDLAEALALLTPEQVEKAKEFVDEQRAEADRLLRSRSS
jgi:hypothetical protein